MRKAATVEVPQAGPGEKRNTVKMSKFVLLTEDWFDYGTLERHSPRTIESRRLYIHRLIKFLEEQQSEVCGRDELRQFFQTLDNAKSGGELRPSTAETYHRNFCAFFNWLVAEGELTESPMRRVPKPRVPKDQIQPLSNQQQIALIAAARKSHFAERNQALIMFLLDTGARASEVAGIKIGDLDMDGQKVYITGKGNKRRAIFFGRRTTLALRLYLEEKIQSPTAGVFVAETGKAIGEPLKRNGILQIVWNLAEAAEIKGVRCSPHTLRHTFAVNFLRNGGSIFSLRMLLGHESLVMTQRYVALAEADLENQHRQSAPVDRLGCSKRKATK